MKTVIPHSSPEPEPQPESAIELSGTATSPQQSGRSKAPLLRLWHQVDWSKLALFAVSLFLFTLAIILMKEGAASLTPLIRNRLDITHPLNSLGFGWLFAYLVMSGSPVAASALTFFDAGVLDELTTFSMITGSRLGASLIVLMIGFLYVLRGRDKITSLSMGLLSLIVTATTHLPGLFLGAFILQKGVFDNIQLKSDAKLLSAIDLFINPIANLLASLLPDWAVFLVGLGVVLISFGLFDRCLPQVTIKESELVRLSRLIYRPWVMFALGALITLISMSVSLSLSILVPLNAKGYVRRENVIPYIMGANVTTFIDTLLAAVLLRNPPAFTIVLVEMVSITIISIFILLTVYHPYNQRMIRFEEWITASNGKLTVFVVGIVLFPIMLMLN